ncbi:MAG: hypothetical protein J3R72DRAFT_451076 [Linnemannia gamsii]|nr:MAG: hypothetical protein J3R72DRAFT_451076 [Linnemannia gamsii]
MSERPPGPSLHSIPELLEIIGYHLTIPQLARCTGTCRLWHQTLMPLLWETFDDSRFRWPKILSALNSVAVLGRLDKHWLDGLFLKYGHHIKTLRVQRHETVLAATECGKCLQLVSLQALELKNAAATWETQGWEVETMAIPSIVENAIGPTVRPYTTVISQNTDLKTVRLFWTLVYHNSSTLRSLHLDRSFKKLCSLNSDRLLDTILGRLRNLVELSNILYPVKLDLLLQQLPYLQSIRGSFVDDKSITPFTNLRILDSMSPLDPPTVRLYLQKFPNLDSLTLAQLEQAPAPQMISYLLHQQQQQQQAVTANVQKNNTSFPLKQFHYRYPRGLLHKDCAKNVLTWFPYLTHITLNVLTPETAQHLAKHCTLLESFRQILDEDIFNPSYITDTVIKLLGACPNLKVLDTIQHRITAQALLCNPPWVCHGLETFRCQIVGVSRLSASDAKALHDLISPVSSANVFLTTQQRIFLRVDRETTRQQQKILERFSRLTCLKVLEVSFKKNIGRSTQEGFIYVDYNPDTLELTLDSGLGQLASLKDLEMFGFEGCCHDIGLTELQWMIDSWPRLKSMRGLRRNGLATSPFEVKKTNLRDYIQHWRPDIQQQGGDRQ